MSASDGVTAGAGVLAIGDELLAGAHPDLNSPVIAEGLSQLGHRVRRVAVVGDDELEIAGALSTLCSEHDLVVATGGLGPTLDDVTRHAAARAARVPLVRSEEAARGLVELFASLGRPMPAANDRQALLPEGARLLPNRCGSAPGFHLRVDDADLFVLPGPPSEMRAMLEAEVLPWVARHAPGRRPFAVRRFHLIGLAEAAFADKAGDWMERGANPLMGVTAKGGVLSVRLVARAESSVRAEALVETRAELFLGRFGEHVFSSADDDPADALGRALIERRISIALAESCTGGWVAARLTRVPGISAVFREAFVTYSDEAKIARLGVDPELVRTEGAVSLGVAEAMAAGAAERSGADLAGAVTGIAGPGGGRAGKPVGLVCFGVSFRGVVRSREERFGDLGRERVRERAATRALALLLRTIDEGPPS